MTNIKYTLRLFAALLAISFLSACDSEDEQPVIALAVSSAIIDAEVGGEKQPNQVFIDLSSRTQTAVNRESWDLGFYSGNQFRVILNNPTSMLAQTIDKNDLTQVTAEDTLGMGSKMDVDAIFGALFGPPSTWLSQAQTWVDDPKGLLSKTAIAEVAAEPSENLVYIINRGKNADGTSRGWVKARFLRSGNGYAVQYADIGADIFNEIQVTKNSDFNFNYLSFSSGEVAVEPAKANWDIAFTVFTDLLQIDATIQIPYSIKDYVIQNLASVTIAEVAITETAYVDLTLADALDLTYSSEVSTIGTGWRNVAQPNSDLETGVKSEVYYVVKDAANNYYKLRFTRMLNPTSGNRGYPQIQYDLLDQ